MTTRVHVTGAAGLVGSHVARRWIDLGAEVTVSDNLTAGYLDNIPDGAKFTKADCCALTAMVEMTWGCDLVYHCAASPHEGLSVFSPLTITRSVFEASVSVATACAVNGVRRLVFCSSMARYGEQAIPFLETQPTVPIDPYGIAKVAAEQEIALLAKIHGFEYAVAVPHNIIGVGQKYDDPFRNVVGIMINRCLREQPPVIYGDGGQRRCFSFIEDAVACLVELGRLPEAAGQIVNIGPDEEFVSINDLAGLVMSLTGFRGDPIHVEDRPQEVRLATCSAEKARRMFGYETRTTLEEGVRQMVEWIRRRGPRPFDYYLPIEIRSPKLPRTWRDKLL